jgi:hypothetical protein
MTGRQIVDRESAAITGAGSNDALHARWRLTIESYTATGKLLSSTVNGILKERHSPDTFSYPKAVPAADVEKWTDEVKQQVETWPASRKKTEILRAIEQGRVKGAIYKWPK